MPIFWAQGFFVGGFVASNNVKIKDLIIKVKAADLEKAAKDAGRQIVFENIRSYLFIKT